MSNSKSTGDVYFGADTPDKLVPYLSRKSQIWFDSLIQTNYLDKLRKIKKKKKELHNRK